MSDTIFIFTPTKLKRKIIFVALRINKKITFYCDKLSIETKKSQIHTPPPPTQLRYNLARFFSIPVLNRACSKMKSAQWGFSFTKSNIHFLKQLCQYFNYME
jgi:hypothetical protein